jgi:hypothetical protein
MSIFKNLKKVHKAVVDDLLNEPPTLSALINNAAVKAVMGGRQSGDFKSYMAIFADNPAQLERLTVPVNNEPAYLEQMRAYIVSNAICDIGTNSHTGNNVKPKIDGGEDGVPVVSDTVDDVEMVKLRPQGLKNILP